ncbi:MAG: hypothetical protein RR224_11615 [Clostridia bacterium]
MKIEVNEKDRLATFWLVGAEQADGALQEQLKPQITQYRQQKYTVAVFKSGSGNLLDTTAGLLLHNQKLAAQRDLEREQECEEPYTQTMSM